MACFHDVTGYQSVCTLLFIPKTSTVMHVFLVVLMVQRTVYWSCISRVKRTGEDQDPQCWARAGEGDGIIFTRERGFIFIWSTLVGDLSTVAEKSKVDFYFLVISPLLESWTWIVFIWNNCFWRKLHGAVLFCLTHCFNNVEKRLDGTIKIISSYSWTVKVLAGLGSIVSRDYRNLKLIKYHKKKYSNNYNKPLFPVDSLN